MPLILNIDTSNERGLICISKNGSVLGLEEHADQKGIAGWLHDAINRLLIKNKLTLHNLDAVAVNNGPGSYTGLRIGLATAKGLCYSLNKPLLCIDSLELMAYSVKGIAKKYICPMIDARRMEVFTAIYDTELNIIKAPYVEQLTNNSFFEILINNEILFIGNGAEKFQRLINNKNATFIVQPLNVEEMTALSTKLYLKKTFSNLAYVEPFYVKDAYINV